MIRIVRGAGTPGLFEAIRLQEARRGWKSTAKIIVYERNSQPNS